MKLLNKSELDRKQAFLGVRLKESTKAELEKLCEINGLTLSSAVEQIIVNYINYSKEIQDRLKRI